MIDRGKRALLGVRIDAVDYEAALERVVAAARDGRPYGVSALAVHGVMTGVLSRRQRHRLNRLDLVTPDGQPVRWALNGLYGTGLPDQVHGAVLTARLLARAETDGLAIYLHGSTPETLARLRAALAVRHPRLAIAGAAPSRFGTATPGELAALAAQIASSGARILLVGLGCPRQETFVSAIRDHVPMPALAVGAAFDYLSGSLREPPAFARRHGLEWLWRLALEPRRLWRRYLLLNPAYVVLVAAQALRWRFDEEGEAPPADEPIPA